MKILKLYIWDLKKWKDTLMKVILIIDGSGKHLLNLKKAVFSLTKVQLQSLRMTQYILQVMEDFTIIKELRRMKKEIKQKLQQKKFLVTIAQL